MHGWLFSWTPPASLRQLPGSCHHRRGQRPMQTIFAHLVIIAPGKRTHTLTKNAHAPSNAPHGLCRLPGGCAPWGCCLPSPPSPSPPPTRLPPPHPTPPPPPPPCAPPGPAATHQVVADDVGLLQEQSHVVGQMLRVLGRGKHRLLQPGGGCKAGGGEQAMLAARQGGGEQAMLAAGQGGGESRRCWLQGRPRGCKHRVLQPGGGCRAGAPTTGRHMLRRPA